MFLRPVFSLPQSPLEFLCFSRPQALLSEKPMKRKSPGFCSLASAILTARRWSQSRSQPWWWSLAELTFPGLQLRSLNPPIKAGVGVWSFWAHLQPPPWSEGRRTPGPSCPLELLSPPRDLWKLSSSRALGGLRLAPFLSVWEGVTAFWGFTNTLHSSLLFGIWFHVLFIMAFRH